MDKIFPIYQEQKEKLDRILDWELQDRYILGTKKEVRAFFKEKGVLLDVLPSSENKVLTSFCDAPSLIFEGLHLKFLSINADLLENEEKFLRATLYEYAFYLLHRRYFEYMAFPIAKENPTFQVADGRVGYRYATIERENEYLNKTTTSMFGEDKAACYIASHLCGKVITREDFESLSETQEQNSSNIIPMIRK